MRKVFSSAIKGLTLAVVLTSGQLTSAERLATENFDYAAGNLYGQGGWVKYNANNNDDPIQLLAPGLTYPDYQDEATGLAANLTGPSSSITQQRLQKQLFSNEDSRMSGITYYSFLVNVATAPVGDVYFFAPVLRSSKTAEGIVEGKTGSEFGRIFTSTGDTEGTFKFGIAKNAASPAVKTADLQLNTTYLVVMKFEIVDDTTNDIVTLWVNPAKGSSDPTEGALVTTANADPSTAMGLQGIELRQGTSATKTGSTLSIDAIRVADSYADLWADGDDEGDTPEPPTPADGTITAPAELNFGYMFQYQTATLKLPVKAESITGPVTVSLPAGFTASTTAIPQEDATAGYDLEITYKATGSGAISETLTLSADGADNVQVSLKADVTAVTPYARLNFFQNLGEGDEKVYQFQGKATVTHVDTSNQLIYMQDIYGAGGCFSYAYFDESPLAEGDRVQNFYCSVFSRSLGATTMLLYPIDFSITPGYTVEPLELTLHDLAFDAESYIFRLVKINDVTFGNPGDTFSTASTAVSDASGSGQARTFSGSDLGGTAIPEAATSITGISTSATAAVVTMRSKNDLEANDTPVDEPSIDVVTESLISAKDYQPINTTANLAKLTISYANLTSPAQIYLTGTNRAMFAVDAEEIPAGTGTLELTVTYTPTQPGAHKANILIDAVPTELSQSFALAASAYDPENMPELSADTSTLAPFTAKVGESSAQTITYTVKNQLDFGTAKIVLPHQGQFLISSGSLSKYDGTYNLTITFNPTQTGTFTETIELTSDLCEPVTFQITGTATGAAPVEEVQGDILSKETFAVTPRKLVVEDFNSCGERNKPMSIDGWTNTALEGTRAWWAYNPDDDDNYAAKITAYDMLATEESDATMLLLSPALDYKNADERILTFKVMGDFMAEGGTGYFNVFYIDATGISESTATGADVLDELYIEPIDGLNIPASSDYNKEWVDYCIDLDGLDLADTFFIGFNYSAPRGKNYPAVYYVDDFSWGRSDIPFIRTDVKALDYTDGNGNRIESADINVTGLNLSDEIAVSTVGAHASNFTPDKTTLPSNGGTVTVYFASEERGIHEAYLKLSHDGAPDTYVTLTADNDKPSGISSIKTGTVEVEGIYTLSGIKLTSPTPAPGIYIVKLSDGTTLKKVIK